MMPFSSCVVHLKGFSPIKPSKCMIPNHLEFLELSKNHALEIQVSTFSIHHFQNLNEKSNLHIIAYGVLKVKALHSN
jgi:hypothetical protein